MLRSEDGVWELRGPKLMFSAAWLRIGNMLGNMWNQVQD